MDQSQGLYVRSPPHEVSLTQQTITGTPTLNESSTLHTDRLVSQFSLRPVTQTRVTTTTTTISTTFPPIVFRKPRRRLSDFDSNAYPLKDAPTPAPLKKFKFFVDGCPAVFSESDDTERSLMEDTITALRGNDGLVETVSTHYAQPDSLQPNMPYSNTQIVAGTSTIGLNESQKRAAPFEGQQTGTRGRQKRSRGSVDENKTHVIADADNPFVAPKPVRGQKQSAAALFEGIDQSKNNIFSTSVRPAAKPENDDNDDMAHIDMTSPQSLSLPSPLLSPVTAGLQAQNLTKKHQHNNSSLPQHNSVTSDLDTQVSRIEDTIRHGQQSRSLMDIPAILDSFDDLPDNVQSYLMYHLLKRCNKATLQVVAGVVLSYLDVQSLCRAAQVSRRWKEIVDEDEFTWKNRLEADQFEIEDGELELAIRDGWGLRQSPAFGSLRRQSVTENSSKAPLGRTTQQFVREHFEEMVNSGLRQPLVGQHLYKAIYRRHHVNFQTWMNPAASPSHICFPSHGRNVVTCLQLDDDKVITGSEDMCINIFDIVSGVRRNSLQGHEGGVWALQYLDDILVSGSTDRTVRIWSLDTGECLHVFEGHTSTVRCLQILPSTTEEGQHLIITGSRDSTLRIWRLPRKGDPEFRSNMQSPSSSGSVDANPYHLLTLVGHTQSVRAIAGEGDLLVSGSYDCTVRVWRISTGECLWTLTGHREKVYSVVIDSKRHKCISGSMDWKVNIWDLDSGNCVRSLEGHSSLVGLLSLSHERLVSAAADSTLRIWNPNTGECTQTLSAHTGAITCFQHDGDKVISGSDGSVKLWDIKTGKFCRDLLTNLSYVWQVRFDDRRCVAAVQREGTTFIEVLDFGNNQSIERQQSISLSR